MLKADLSYAFFNSDFALHLQCPQPELRSVDFHSNEHAALDSEDMPAAPVPLPSKLKMLSTVEWGWSQEGKWVDEEEE